VGRFAGGEQHSGRGNCFHCWRWIDTPSRDLSTVAPKRRESWGMLPAERTAFADTDDSQGQLLLVRSIGREGTLSDNRLVRDVGEFALIEILAHSLPEEVKGNESLQMGIGDDAAIWQPTDGEQTVLTTDSLVEDTHFRAEWSDWESLGHKA